MATDTNVTIAGTVPNREEQPKFTTQKEQPSSSNAQKSVEGWVIVATGVHEEASEEDLRDLFSDFGRVRSLRLNLDRQTGYVKGYALIEYADFESAQQAVNRGSGRKLLGKPLVVDFEFIEDSPDQLQKGRVGRSATQQEHSHRCSRPEAEESREREKSPNRGF